MDRRIHKLITDVAVLSGGVVLLVRYRDVSRYDGQRGWFLPDDLLQHLEHPTDGAKRVLSEQVGVEGSSPALDHIESFGNGSWHLTFHHRLDLGELPLLSAGENVRDAEWFAVDALPEPEEVAHDGWALDVLATMLTSGQRR